LETSENVAHIHHQFDGLQEETRPAMTLTTRLFRLFSLAQSRSAAGRSRVPRLDSLRLSNHDLADLNLPPAYQAQLDAGRSFIADQHR
jgi:hypothetical protein